MTALLIPALAWPRCECCGGPALPVGPAALVLEYDVETRNEANGTTQRWAKVNRRRGAREATIEALSLAGGQGRALPSSGPWYVRMTRLSAGELDDDAIPLACKTIRDTLAAALGVDDRDRAVAWTYGQAYRRELGVRVEVWGS